MDFHEEVDTNGQSSKHNKKSLSPRKGILYGIGTIICLLVTLDTIHQLYFIYTQWNHEAALYDITHIVRKVLAMLGWIFITWYTADKCLEKNG